MKKVTLVLLAVISMALVSCGGGGNKDVNKVKRLTYSVFDFFNNYQQDSLMILMPNIDYDYCDFLNDSINITSVKLNENNQHYDVQLTKDYSENSTPESNVHKTLSLEFAKAEDNPFGFVVVNSKGFTVADKLPDQILYSGAIKENRKYSDKEYKEMLKVSDALLQFALNKATDEINSSVKVMLNYYPTLKKLNKGANAGTYYGEDFTVYNPSKWMEAINDGRLHSWEDKYLKQMKSDHSGEWMAMCFMDSPRHPWQFKAQLVNNTKYDINGGVITYTVAEYQQDHYKLEAKNKKDNGKDAKNLFNMDSAEFWEKEVYLHKPQTYKLAGEYDFLAANSTNLYFIEILPKGEKFDWHYEWTWSVLWVDKIDFSITPEAVLANNSIQQLFDGTEYDEYMKALRANE